MSIHSAFRLIAVIGILWTAMVPSALPANAAGGGETAETRRLFDAVFANDFAAVEASTAAGAEVDARDQWGLTPVDYAIDKGNFKIAHFLISRRNQIGRASGGSPSASAAAQPEPSASAPGPAAGHRAAPVTTAPAAPAGGRINAAASAPAWPADRPNPFDPASPAPGATGPAIVQR